MKIRCSAGIYDVISHNECLGCAASKLIPECKISYPMLVAIYNYMEKERDPRIHVTEVISCLRKAYMERKTEVIRMPHTMLPLLLGSAVHFYVEHLLEGNDFGKSEVPLEMDNLVGKADFITDDAIYDFKTASTLGGIMGSHGDQLNVYRQMFGQERRMFVQYLHKGGASKCAKCRISLEPQNGIPTCPRCGKKNYKGHFGFDLQEVEPSDDIDVWRMRAAALAAHLDSNTVPEAEQGWLCKYCDVECDARNNETNNDAEEEG